MTGKLTAQELILQELLVGDIRAELDPATSSSTPVQLANAAEVDQRRLDAHRPPAPVGPTARYPLHPATSLYDRGSAHP